MWISPGLSPVSAEEFASATTGQVFLALAPPPARCLRPWPPVKHQLSVLWELTGGSLPRAPASLCPSAVAPGASPLGLDRCCLLGPCVSRSERGSGAMEEHEVGPARPPCVSWGQKKASLLSSLLVHRVSPLTRDPHEKSSFISARRICFLSSRTQAHIPKAGLGGGQMGRSPHCLSRSLFALGPLSSALLHLQVDTAASGTRARSGS